MDPLRILITNNTLANRAGTELYVRDVACALLARGHQVVAFSTQLGEVAKEMRRASVPVVDRLDALAPPDLIHGQHHLETMMALLRFPGVPAVYFCHGFLPWEEMPLLFPRIRRYVAVGRPCRDRLCLEHGIAESRVDLIYNFADLDRFRPRPALPKRARRALLFNNHATDQVLLPVVRAACARFGVSVEVVGITAGTTSAAPENTLQHYDLVFATGRSAIEALAVGNAVVLCHLPGVGGLVTTKNFDDLRPLNFGLRALQQPVTEEILTRAIAGYDALDAAAVSRRLRAVAGRDGAIDQLVAVYRQALADHAAQGPCLHEEEFAAAAQYLFHLKARVHERDDLLAEKNRWQAERIALVNSAPAVTLRSWLKTVPILGPLGRRVVRGLRAATMRIAG